jgi:hypothetical protein
MTNISLTATNKVVVMPWDGNWQWRVVSIDKAGNQSAYGSTGLFHIDTTGPVVQLLQPADHSTIYTNFIKFQWSANDSAGIGVTNFIIDLSTSNFANCLSVTQSGTVFSSILPYGLWKWRITASDRLGNRTVSSTDSFTCRPFAADLSELTVTDGIHTVNIPVDSASTVGVMNDNTGITVSFRMAGDVKSGSVVYLVYGIQEQPDAAHGLIPARWSSVNNRWEAQIPQDTTVGKSGQTFYFYFQVDSHPIGNENILAPFQSWSFALGAIKKQSDSFTILNNVINKGSVTPVSLIYSLAVGGKVNISIYDISGQLVITLVDKDHAPGVYVIRWYGKNEADGLVGKGIYFVVAHIGNSVESRKVMVK